ncbi:MAG: HU family DNA-binding protein [Oscillospiraceae bacterium]|jgi:DNA-binding protein HU-beta|nr:HU family DNA-binding protein [Oscillospiraceae bacterium]
MNKSELVASVAKKSGLSKKDSEKAVLAFIKSVIRTLSKGEKVQLIGFGTFDVRKRPQRQGRNPSTNKIMTIKASCSPVFKAGKQFKDTVNRKCKCKKC